MKPILTATGIAVLTAGAVLASGVAHGQDRPTAPASLQVPAGNKTVAVLQVLQGTQTYTCAGGAWRFTEPGANLGAGGQPTALHTAGPQWVSTVDGSAVWGSTLGSVPATGAIPELLVKAVKNRGTGLFGRVDFIQRLETSGGLAPAGSCADGAIAAVPYHATYIFWAPDDNHS